MPPPDHDSTRLVPEFVQKASVRRPCGCPRWTAWPPACKLRNPRLRQRTGVAQGSSAPCRRRQCPPLPGGRGKLQEVNGPGAPWPVPAAGMRDFTAAGQAGHCARSAGRPLGTLSLTGNGLRRCRRPWQSSTGSQLPDLSDPPGHGGGRRVRNAGLSGEQRGQTVIGLEQWQAHP